MINNLLIILLIIIIILVLLILINDENINYHNSKKLGTLKRKAVYEKYS